MKRRLLYYLIGIITLFAPVAASARQVNSNDIKTPDGYKIEAAVTELAAPTMVAFDNEGRMLIAESGYGGGGEPKVTRIEKDGKRTVLATTENFGKELPLTAVAYNNDKIYTVHGGSVSTISSDGKFQTILTGIPNGDHQANQLVFKDGKVYLAVGTVTNSGVVGEDNAVFRWLLDPDKRNVHDVPCTDLELTGEEFESADVLGNEEDWVTTSAFSAFGTLSTNVKGNTKCNGSVLRFNPDGTGLEVYAWGFRNPYGLEIGPDNQLYATMHGFDARGSRPIENAWDCFYKVEQGKWYGWPDFACDTAITNSRFEVQDKPAPQFLIKNPPNSQPPVPIAKFDPHSAINGFSFAPNDNWGKPTDTFIALFGDFTPATGTVSEPQGVKVVKVSSVTGEISDFITNKVAGQASRHSAGGLEHPSDVTFGPDGAMYITDWGIAQVSTEGLKLDQNSGVVWKVTRAAGAAGTQATASPSLIITVLGTLVLALGTFWLSRGDARVFKIKKVAVGGLIAGAIAGVVAILISTLIMELPWHVPPRVLASIPIGQTALANILEFRLTPVLVGVLTLVLTALVMSFVFNLLLASRNPLKILLSSILFGLTVWATLQYFVFTHMFPLVIEKGFPPQWYALTFASLGLALGISAISARSDIEWK